MRDVMAVATPLAEHFKLSIEQMSKTDQERKEMSSIPYANIIGSIMYIMIYTRPDVSHARALNVGLHFENKERSGGHILEGYCDSDYAANIDNRKAQSRYIFTLYGTAISWKSDLQSVVALSTTEAEFISLTEVVKEGLYNVIIKCDSNSVICLAEHQTFYERSKHINFRRHFIRDEIQEERVRIVKVSTEDNAAGMLTKALPTFKFRYCLELVDLVGC
ncbi:25S rRNA (cytosine(2870)-C(5))-methyltransferase [Salvia divinorum]|uniref:25S rRNA (Cytosine(2870)-C(5))-methyltransferase n=1 Tax=Salvia divinorum TaxID=28513 RepID=A0ABD1GL32_SALDI